MRSFVRSILQGEILGVSIGEIMPDDWAWTWSWPRGERAAELGLAGAPHYVQVWDVDPAKMVRPYVATE